MSCLFSLIGFSIILRCVFMTTDDDAGVMGVVGLAAEELEAMSEEEEVSYRMEDYGRTGEERGEAYRFQSLRMSKRHQVSAF